MSAENNEMLTFVSLALSIVITSCYSAICGVFSINSQVQVQIRSRADEEERPVAHTLFNYNRFKAEFLFTCVRSK